MSLSAFEINQQIEEGYNYETQFITNWHRTYNKDKIKVINLLNNYNEYNYSKEIEILNFLVDTRIMGSWSTFFLGNFKGAIDEKQFQKLKDTNPEWFI